MKLAIFISGEGTNLQALIDAVKNGDIKAEIGLVFSNKRKAHGLKRAEAAGIKTLFLPRKDYATPQSYERDIVINLKEEGIDAVILAGYMRILSAFFIKQFPNKIINVHPSLLPSFKGARGIKDTFTYGVKCGGVTIHFVDEKMDHGPIILQESIKISDTDTLESYEEKIHTVEHRLLPKAVAYFADDRLKIIGRKVMLLP